MTRLFWLLVVLVGAAAAGWYFSRLEFPVEEEISLVGGESFRGEIVGKSRKTLTVDRSDDGTRMILNHSELAWPGRLLVYRLKERRAPRLELPVERELTNAEGKSFAATVIGKEDEEVVLVRQADGKRFTISLDMLSEKDREYLDEFRDREAPKEEVKVEDLPPFVVRRIEEIKKLRRRIEQMKLELKSGTLNRILANQRRKQIADAEQEIRKLIVSISDYGWKTKYGEE